jgi:hypothetical protein
MIPDLYINENEMWECRDCFADLGSSHLEALKHKCPPTRDERITDILSKAMIALLAFAIGFSVALIMAEHEIDVAHAVVKAHCGTE